MTKKVDLIMRVYPNLEKYTSHLQASLERLALCTGGNTLKLASKMDDILQKKICLVNLRVMVDEILNELTEKERFAISMVNQPRKIEVIAKKTNSSTLEASKLLRSARDRFERMMKRYPVDDYDRLVSA